MTLVDWHKSLLALCIWRESEGEPLVGKIGVGSVIRNRVHASHVADNWAGIVDARMQFSSMTVVGNPRLVAWPVDKEPEWDDCMTVAGGIYDGTILDNTGGATMYANLDECDPKWAHTMTFTVKLGKQSFFK